MDRNKLKKIFRVIEIIAFVAWIATGNYPDPNAIRGIVSEHMYQTARLYYSISFVAVAMLASCVELLLKIDTWTKKQFIQRAMALALFDVAAGVVIYLI